MSTRVEAAARAHWQDGQGWDELPEATKNIARSFMSKALAAADRAALANAEGVVRWCEERANAASQQASGYVGNELVQARYATEAQQFRKAAATIQALSSRVAELEAGLKPFAAIAEEIEQLVSYDTKVLLTIKGSADHTTTGGGRHFVWVVGVTRFQEARSLLAQPTEKKDDR